MSEVLDESSRPAETGVVESFCTQCQRVAYVSEGAELVCPVCSSPLLPVSRASQPEGS